MSKQSTNGETESAEKLRCGGCGKHIRVGTVPERQGRVYLCECPDLDPKPVRTTVVLPGRWDFK